MAIEAELADGRILEFPDGTDPLVIQATIKRMIAGGKAAQPQSGFVPAMKAGWEDLKGSLAGLAGRSGLMSIKAAEEQQARNKAEAARVFKPTEGTWFDSPMAKLAETAGGSLPYMAAPLAAGAGAAFAGAPALAAAGAAGLASATQFTGSNLARQQDEGKKLADTDLGAAALASVPQAALDVVGFKMIPGIRRIFAAAGKELTPKAAAEIAKQGLKSTLADYAKSGVKASGVEGLTEASQQVFERLQAGLALNDEAAREEYLQNFIGGAALGGALSVPGRFHERGRAQLRAAQIEEQKQIKAEQDAAALAQQQEQEKVARLQTPEGAGEVADRYQKAEATYRSMLPGKLAKDADEATKFEHAARAKQAKEFLEAELKPLIPDYLVAKKTLEAQAAAQPPAPEPGTPEEEAGLLFTPEPLAPGTNMSLPLIGRGQIPVPENYGGPTEDNVEARRAYLAERRQALEAHITTLMDQGAKAETPEDSVRIGAQDAQARKALSSLMAEMDSLPKPPKAPNYDKQFDNAKKAWLKAKEEGDAAGAAKHASKMLKMQNQMWQGPEMDMAPAGGKSETQEEFFPRIATGDVEGGRNPQLGFDYAKNAFETLNKTQNDLPQIRAQREAEEAQRRKDAEAAERQKRTDAEVAKMGERPLDTQRTAQPDLFDNPEMRATARSGPGAVSQKSKAQLVSDLMLANIFNDKAAQIEAREGLRDLKANERPTAPTGEALRTEAELLKDFRDARFRGDRAAARAAAERIRTQRTNAALGQARLPPKIAKQQATRDAFHRAYGNLVLLLDRFNRGQAKREERDAAFQAVLDAVVSDAEQTRGHPFSPQERDRIRGQAKSVLLQLVNRYGDTRSQINRGTKKKPDMTPVQEYDGEFIRDAIPRPLGTANLETRQPGDQTFDRPYAAAQALKGELEAIGAAAVNAKPGQAGVVGVQTPKTTSPEALAKALETAKPSPLVERLKDNLAAISADPERRNLAAEWLYRRSTGVDMEPGAPETRGSRKPDLTTELTAILDRLDEGGRSETENTPAVRRGLYNPGREGSEARVQQGDLLDDVPQKEQTVAPPTEGQRNIERQPDEVGAPYSLRSEKPDEINRGEIFQDWEQFDKFLASDGLDGLREGLQQAENVRAMSAAAPSVADKDRHINLLKEYVAAHKALLPEDTESTAYDTLATKIARAQKSLANYEAQRAALLAAGEKKAPPTASRVAAQQAVHIARSEELRKTLASLQAQHAALTAKQSTAASSTAARVQKAIDKVQERIRDYVVTHMEPLHAEIAADEKARWAAQKKLTNAYANVDEVEQAVRDNIRAFLGNFRDNDPAIGAAVDAWEKAGADYRAALDDEMANGTDRDYFSAGPVREAGARKQEALTEALRLLMDDLAFLPPTTKLLAFLNEDLRLHIALDQVSRTVPKAQARLQDRIATVLGKYQLLEMAPATLRSAAQKAPEVEAAKREVTNAKKATGALTARDKAINNLARMIVATAKELSAATSAVDAAMKPVLDAQRARAKVGTAPKEDLQAKANEEQRAKNDSLERLAAIPGEQIKFSDMQAVAEAFAEMPGEVARLEAKAENADLPDTTRNKAKVQAKRARWKIANLRGLLSADPESNKAAKEAAVVQIAWLKDKIEAKRIAAAEMTTKDKDGNDVPVKESTIASRKRELKALRAEVRDLETFISEFDAKITRTPIETAAERKERLSTPPPDIRGVKGTSKRAEKRMAELQAVIEDDTKTDAERAAARETQQRMLGTVPDEVQADIDKMQAIVDNPDASPGARRMAQTRIQMLSEGRLPPSRQGPLVKKKVQPPQTVNRVTNSGRPKPVSGTQAQRAANKDTAYEAATIKLGELEDTQQRAENALDVAEAALIEAKGAEAKAKAQERVTRIRDYLVRLEGSMAKLQKFIDDTDTGKKRKSVDIEVKTEALADRPKEAAALAAATKRKAAEREEELASATRARDLLLRKFDALNKSDKTPVQRALTHEKLMDAWYKLPADVRKGQLPPGLDTTWAPLTPTQAAEIKDNNLLGALDSIANEKGNDDVVKAVAQKLAATLQDVDVKVVDGLRPPGGDPVRGAATTHLVALDSVDGMNQETVLHEGVHAATLRTLRAPEEQLSQTQRVAKQELKALHAAAQRDATITAMHDKTDLLEFASEVMSNPKLQAQLKNKPWKLSDAWNGFKSIVLRLLGVKTPDNMLYAAMQSVEALMVAPKTQQKVANEKPQNLTKNSAYAVGKLIAQERTFKDRLGGNLARAAEMHTVDMRAPARDALFTGNKRLAEQAMYYVRKNDARMPQVYSVFQHGALGLKQDARGRYVVEAGNSKSVQDVFKAIEKISGATAAEKMEKAQVYLTAKRALADPKAAFALDLGKGGATPEALKADLAKLTADPKQKAALEDMARTYADLNRGMIKFLADTGAISKKDAAAYTASDTYVPYYRVRADGVAEFVFDETKVIRLGDIRTQPYLKALEGSDVKLMPLNESITRNVMLLTDLGMRNLTTRNVAYALQDIGKGKGPPSKSTGKPTDRMPIRQGKAPADVKAMVFKQDGEEYHLIVDTEGTAAEGIPSEMVARSLEGSYTVIPSFLKAFGWAGDVLRAGVTRNPMYVARQLFRDPFAASFTGGLDRGPLAAVAKAVAAFTRQSAGRNNSTADALIRKGVVQSGIFSGDPDDLAKMSLQLAGGNEGAFNKLFSLMDRAAMRADSVTRQQLYDDVLKRTGSEMEAEMAAMEMMNFSKRGLSPTVQYFSRMIPFFNAQIQGLNVLHKALTGKATMQERLGIQQKFWDRAGMLMAGTLIYAMAMEDDDTYKNARPSDRYANWFVPLSRDPSNPANDVTIKLPIPFEVGLLMKAVPEALIDFMRGESTEQHWKAIRTLFLNQIPGGSSFMMPQLAKPLIEVGTNHSFFTGREIEGANMKGLDPQERYTARTTELAKRMSEMLQSDLTPDTLKLSPLQIEHLARGYLGSLPVMAAAAMNQVFGTPNVEAPDRKLTETPLIGTSFQDRYGNGATDILYAKIKAADQAKATFDKMVNEGRKQDAKMYLADIENLQTIPMLRQAEGKLQYLSKQEKAVRNSDNTPERKRELLDIIAAKREAESRKYLDAVAAVSR
jgi:hypothetical protein